MIDEARFREEVKTYLDALAEKAKEIVALTHEMGESCLVEEEDLPRALEIVREEIDSLDAPPEFKLQLQKVFDPTLEEETYVV